MKTKRDKYVELAKEIILRNLDKEKFDIFLFGSRADGSFQKSSDIDIGVIGKKPLGKIYYRIMSEMEESIIPYNVQVVDFTDAKESFKNIVLNGKVIIWNRSKYFNQNFPTIKKH